MRIQCAVYKGSKKPGSFLFIERANDFSRVPPALLRMLGELQEVMTLELHPDRKLAQAEVASVMQKLREQGYYLQMPSTTWQEFPDQ
jgi:uncharacterized protein YcgL (UPF0745 family)